MFIWDPGSRIPDLGPRISDPGFKNNNKVEAKKFSCLLFCNHKIHRIKIWTKKNFNIYYPQNCHQSVGIRVGDPGSGKRYPGSGSKGQKGTGSRIQIQGSKGHRIPDPDPGVKKHRIPEPVSGSAGSNRCCWLFAFHSESPNDLLLRDLLLNWWTTLRCNPGTRT